MSKSVTWWMCPNCRYSMPLSQQEVHTEEACLEAQEFREQG